MSGSPVAVALHGACGRMGQAIERALDASEDFTLAYRADRRLAREAGPPRTGPDLEGLAAGDVGAIVDFSSPAGAVQAARAARRLGVGLVSGTTGLDAAARGELEEAAGAIPVCWAANFSVGVPVLTTGLRGVAGLLPRGWAVEIIDIHHDRKRDAPSGTALRFAETWREKRGGRFVYGRHGTGEGRDPEEIGLHALRIGDVVGEHRILLGGPGETIEVIHRVQERAAFAAGCIEALRRLRHRDPGWYEWEELLRRP